MAAARYELGAETAGVAGVFRVDPDRGQVERVGTAARDGRAFVVLLFPSAALGAADYAVRGGAGGLAAALESFYARDWAVAHVGGPRARLRLDGRRRYLRASERARRAGAAAARAEGTA